MNAPRLRGLDNNAAQQVVATAQALAIGRVDQAATQLAPALKAQPDHPEVLRLHAGILSLRGEHASAAKAMRRALELCPLDPLYHNTLGTVLGAAGDFDGAIAALERACELQPDLAMAWYNLGVMLTRCVRNEEAAAALQNAVRLDPGNVEARALLADLLRMQGDNTRSTEQYRRVLAERPWTGMAWWGLADLRDGALKPDDVERMRAALRETHATDHDRIAIGFALSRLLDELGDLDGAMVALRQANAIARLRTPWDARAFSGMVTAIDHAFTPEPNTDTGTDLGKEVLFIVGMPRSGTTLIEQILAAHSEVQGAGELPDLPQILHEESQARRMPYPRWVPDMLPADWRRLGERYLERTARWRRQRPRFTDKFPANWINIGAIRAMLPGAHITIARRDPLETCFACYRQLLPEGSDWNRTPEDLAAFWRDFDRVGNRWKSADPGHVHQLDHAALIADPAQVIRALLAANGLPFEEACLHFHESTRAVRSPSATQVRRPLHAVESQARRYGSALDPLRLCLGLAPFEG